MASPAQPSDLRAVLYAAAADLAALSESAARLQAEISPLLRGGGQAGTAVQGLDPLTQALEAHAGFLAALADQLAPGMIVDAGAAAAGLRLEAVARRLAGGETVGAGPAGELELFD